MYGNDCAVRFGGLARMGRDLPATARILPGHNYSVTPTSTMAEQIEGNPFMHFDQKAEFVEYRMHIHDKVRESPYHPVLK